jgi:hypothetical protein
VQKNTTPQFVVWGERNPLTRYSRSSGRYYKKEHTIPSHLSCEGAIVAMVSKCVQLSVVAVFVVLLCSQLATNVAKTGNQCGTAHDCASEGEKDGFLTYSCRPPQFPQKICMRSPIRAEVERLLLRGYFNARVRGFCKGLGEHRQNLWTFGEVVGV